MPATRERTHAPCSQRVLQTLARLRPNHLLCFHPPGELGMATLRSWDWGGEATAPLGSGPSANAHTGGNTQQHASATNLAHMLLFRQGQPCSSRWSRSGSTIRKPARDTRHSSLEPASPPPRPCLPLPGDATPDLLRAWDQRCPSPSLPSGRSPRVSACLIQPLPFIVRRDDHLPGLRSDRGPRQPVPEAARAWRGHSRVE